MRCLRATLTPEEPGEECAYGGTRLEVGTDQNDDRRVSGDELDSSTVICNGEDGLPGADGMPGANGQDGSDGASALINTTVLDAGAPCPYGGVLIAAGLDNGDGTETAADGVLGAGEIDTTSPVCMAAPLRAEGGCRATHQRPHVYGALLCLVAFVLARSRRRSSKRWVIGLTLRT